MEQPKRVSPPLPPRLSDVLVERGLASSVEVRKALAQQQAQGGHLGEILVANGVLGTDDLRSVLSELLGVPAIDLSVITGDPFVLDRVPKERAFELHVLALFEVENQLTVAMADPANLQKLDELRFLTGKEILPVLALSTDIADHLAEYYGELDPDSGEAAIEFETPSGATIDDSHDLEGAVAESPVVRLVNLVISRAIQQEASDIHLEPQEGAMVVRYRIDGHLQVKSYKIPANAVPAVVSRIKILSQCDISEKRVPQDGKVRVLFHKRRVDVRVSTFPTIYGEKVVMRLLDKERQVFGLDNIGMSDTINVKWKSVLRKTDGIVLVTGPTGSGKSSTLYATLRHLHHPDVNIVTLEDPVEYELAGISQGQVNPRAGFTFASGLRSILRQDPDIILVGEIRDSETAQIAVQAALTGHLVLATLHTNDAPSTLTRLVDIGIPRYLVASSLLGVLAQRLVRRGCPNCVREVDPTEDELSYLGPWIASGIPFLEGAGCKNCSGIGYRGRVGVHELLAIDNQLQRLISQGADDQTIADTAAATGYRRLWWDGLHKVSEGVTTLRELSRSISPDEATPGPTPDLERAQTPDSDA